MAKDRPPSFQFYPRDFISDPAVFAMSHEQRGRYVAALCFSWISGSYGKATEAQWAQWLGYSPEDWLTARDAFLECFTEQDGLWFQERMVEERVEQAERFRQASSGGRSTASTRTPEQRQDAARSAANARWMRTECAPMPTPASASASASALESDSKDAAAPPGFAIAQPPKAKNRNQMDREKVWAMVQEATGRPEAQKSAMAFAGWLWKTGTHQYGVLDQLIRHMVAHRPDNPHAYYANTGNARALIALQWNAAESTREHEAVMAADAAANPRRRDDDD